MATSKSDPTWIEIIGSENWEGLLDPAPVNNELRKFILRCGNFAEATYDVPKNGNELNEVSRGSFFSDVYLENSDKYEVKSFLYANSGVESMIPTSGDFVRNWMGYVAITTDEHSNYLGRREIYVVWRGTSAITEWENNLSLKTTSIQPLLDSDSGENLWEQRNTNGDEPSVHSGFLSVYTAGKEGFKSARDQIKEVIPKLLNDYKNEDRTLVVTGHSLGGALSTLTAFDLVANRTVGSVPVTAVVFSCPRVGNENFKNMVVGNPVGLKILHVRVKADVIPNVPPLLVPVQTKELEVIASKSPYLKWPVLSPKYLHSLEVVLHVVAGWNGSNGDFKLEGKGRRGFTLVNKWTGMLMESYGIPESWWADSQKKGMVYENGYWVHRN